MNLPRFISYLQCMGQRWKLLSIGLDYQLSLEPQRISPSPNEAGWDDIKVMPAAFCCQWLSHHIRFSCSLDPLFFPPPQVEWEQQQSSSVKLWRTSLFLAQPLPQSMMPSKRMGLPTPSTTGQLIMWLRSGKSHRKVSDRLERGFWWQSWGGKTGWFKTFSSVFLFVT